MKRILFAITLILIGFWTKAQTFSAIVNQNIPDDNSTVAFNINVSGLPNTIDQNFGLEVICLNSDLLTFRIDKIR
mgnify:CR=1 FL=1